MSDYSEGFKAGWRAHAESTAGDWIDHGKGTRVRIIDSPSPPKRKRSLSAWQKFVKVNSKKPRFKFKSGAKKGRINLKALGVAYRKTPAGKKKR